MTYLILLCLILINVLYWMVWKMGEETASQWEAISDLLWQRDKIWSDIKFLQSKSEHNRQVITELKSQIKQLKVKKEKM